MPQQNFTINLMKVLIKNATILSPSSPFHGKIKNILIENGIISKVSDDEQEADEIVEAKDLHVSAGWMDCFANFCDPGQEYKETVESGANAAATGGFTEVMVDSKYAPGSLYQKPGGISCSKKQVHSCCYSSDWGHHKKYRGKRIERNV